MIGNNKKVMLFIASILLISTALLIQEDPLHLANNPAALIDEIEHQKLFVRGGGGGGEYRSKTISPFPESTINRDVNRDERQFNRDLDNTINADDLNQAPATVVQPIIVNPPSDGTGTDGQGSSQNQNTGN